LRRDDEPILNGTGQQEAKPASRGFVPAAVALAILAAAVRLYVAGHSYPVRDDAGHFVQFAMELAGGNPEGLSAHWSMAPILVASAAIRMHADPQRAVQLTTVAAGVACVLFAAALAAAVFRSRRAGLLAGIIVAVNPTLVDYSTNGMGEMPYMALTMAGALVARTTLQGAFFGPALALGLAGLALYFRPVEAVVFAATLGAFGAIPALARRDVRRVGAWALAGLVFVALALPLCIHTARHSNFGGPSTKIVNLAFGEYGYDSKAVFAQEGPMADEVGRLKSIGAARYLWERRADFPPRFARNVARLVRFVRDETFAGPFHLGSGWLFALLAAGAVLEGRRGRLREWPFLLCIGFGPALLTCLSFVHPRWVVGAVPYVLILFAGAADTLADLARGRRCWQVVLAGLLAWWVGSGVAMSRGLSWDHWRYDNVPAVARELRRFGGEDDILMTKGPQLPINFYRQHPLRYVEMPYGTMAQTEAHAGRKGVTLIALSSQSYPHWPVNEVFKGAAPPANWELVASPVFCFDDPRYGPQEEKYLLYRRHPEAPAEGQGP
jgi:hypothetical protein